MPGSRALAPEQARQQALSLLDACRVMSLATAGPGGTNRPEPAVWSAPVYFYNQDFTLYFFSKPDSRHIRQGLESGGTCAASVFQDPGPVDQIRGVQMDGRMQTAGSGARAMRAAAAYAGRYGLPDGGGNILAHFRAVFHAAFYCFIPGRVFFLDNGAGFGSRVEVGL